MAPHSEETPVTSRHTAVNLFLTSGFKKYPKYRDDKIKNAHLWLQGKREVDGVFPYWRIHSKLYDLTPFMNNHPGGRFWIEYTQGTDITEAFESSHFGTTPEKIMKKYYVKEADRPRNSPFTFEENGFYKTLKRKATPVLQKVGRGPTRAMLLIQDSLLFAFFLSFLYSAWLNSASWTILAGAMLSLSATASHNFFHQRDNWRMYIFDLTLLNSKEWRISHALSHHVFPNTVYDFEISTFEPFLELLPKSDKSLIQRYLFPVMSYPFYIIAFYIDTIFKLILILKGQIKCDATYSFLLIQMITASVLCGSVTRGLWLWFVLHASCNFVFLLIGLTAAHHHPEIYHEGDAIQSDMDWGLLQVAATRERGETLSSLFLVSISFGNHTLHHLFPTVDHSKLPYLMPALLETCKEFGVKFELSTAWQLYKGFYLQAANIIPNRNVSKCFK